MQEHLIGITCMINRNGETIIPDSDLRFAHDMVTKGESKLMWD